MGADKSAAAVGHDEDEESQENLVAKFQTLAAEGDQLAKKRSFIEAIEIFTRALEIRPTDKHCLVSRSQCYIQIGAADLALADADAALKEFPDYFKAILQKAEALYAKGDFELALMHFHRGNRQRPELDEFRVGIQKAREAIENSIGNTRTDFQSVPWAGLIAAGNNGQHMPCEKRDLKQVLGAAGFGGILAGAPGTGGASNSSGVTYAGGTNKLTPAMEAKLLGELYEDKIYLQTLASDKDFAEHPDSAIIDLVTEGLRYLSTRVDFWKQQHPLYARPKLKKIKPRMERNSHYYHPASQGALHRAAATAPALPTAKPRTAQPAAATATTVPTAAGAASAGSAGAKPGSGGGSGSINGASVSSVARTKGPPGSGASGDGGQGKKTPAVSTHQQPPRLVGAGGPASGKKHSAGATVAGEHAIAVQ
ncbi:Tetratricopeptide repeat protein 25 [Phlyctochytrium bullatum]|nr:Tetratricopeptide repeat protein 25 [Phlyctochytrium bullatum]